MQLLRFQTFAPQFSLRTCNNLKPRTAELKKNIVSCCNTRSLHKKVGHRCRLSLNKTYYELHLFSHLEKVHTMFFLPLQLLCSFFHHEYKRTSLHRTYAED